MEKRKLRNWIIECHDGNEVKCRKIVKLGCFSEPQLKRLLQTLAAQYLSNEHAVWICNRDVLRRIVRGKAFSLREFRSAFEFFEDLTGLEVDWNGTTLGLLPGPDLDQDLEALDAWYELNKDKLSWDAGLGKIVFAGLAPTPGAR